jgi:hypothetical protein
MRLSSQAGRLPRTTFVRDFGGFEGDQKAYRYRCQALESIGGIEGIRVNEQRLLRRGWHVGCSPARTWEVENLESGCLPDARAPVSKDGRTMIID